MKILSIGNSFSRDAQRYLHEIAKADGVFLETFNLYIGGCPLFRHYRNMLSEKEDYLLEMNGQDTGFYVSLKQALLSHEWDVITIQQVSSKSPNYETYQPYLDKLAEYIRTHAPKAKLALQQTWAYEEGSTRLNEELGYVDYKDMLTDVKKAYSKAAKAIKADFIIPSGEVFAELLQNGIEKVHRDTFHASLGLGRYTLGLLWYRVLTGNSVEQNKFRDFDETVSEEQIAIAKRCVETIAKKHKL